MYKISFLSTTLVYACEDCQAIDNYGFNFVPYDDVINNVADARVIVDVIGMVCEYDDSFEVCKDGIRRRKLVLYLENATDEAFQHISNHASGPVVIIIQWCKIKTYHVVQGVNVRSIQAHRFVSNNLYASRLFVNDNLPEIKYFKDQLSELDACLSPMPSRVTTQSFGSPYEDFIVLTDRKKLDEIRWAQEEYLHLFIGV